MTTSSLKDLLSGKSTKGHETPETIKANVNKKMAIDLEIIKGILGVKEVGKDEETIWKKIRAVRTPSDYEREIKYRLDRLDKKNKK